MAIDERPRDSLVKYDPPLELGPASAQASGTGNKLKQQLSKKTTLPPVEFKPQLEDILHALLPPREWVENERNMIQYVSSAQPTRLDVIQLQEALDHKLMERQARETGICPVREELYSQTFDELIRQVCINCPERGLLLLRVRDELRMTIAAYQTLYGSSVTLAQENSYNLRWAKQTPKAHWRILRKRKIFGSPSGGIEEPSRSHRTQRSRETGN